MDKRCGTLAGNPAHLRRKETPCGKCREVRSTYRREYRKKNKERDAEKNRVYGKAYRLANRKKAIAANRAWRLANPDRAKARDKAYNLAHAERGRQHCRARRARKLNAPSEPYTTQDILGRWGTDCHLCREPIDLNAPRSAGLVGWKRGLHLDHVTPLCEGGSDLIENVKPSHGQCNLQKDKKGFCFVL